jgi:hypothetical protein
LKRPQITKKTQSRSASGGLLGAVTFHGWLRIGNFADPEPRADHRGVGRVASPLGSAPPDSPQARGEAGLIQTTWTQSRNKQGLSADAWFSSSHPTGTSGPQGPIFLCRPNWPNGRRHQPQRSATPANTTRSLRCASTPRVSLPCSATFAVINCCRADIRCLVFVKLFEAVYAPRTAGLLSPSKQTSGFRPKGDRNSIGSISPLPLISIPSFVAVGLRAE